MPTREHKASDYLKTPQDIAAYLNAAIDEMDDDPRLLMKAFRNVAEAQGGVSELACQTKLNRVVLSRAVRTTRPPAQHHRQGLRRLWGETPLLRLSQVAFRDATP